ncbi:MAG TPA: DUF6531 domain-containing protein, partial [Casimicrobiaceae bacterium]
MATSIGTVRVALSVTGTGLASPNADDKNAGLRRTLRASSKKPRPLALVFSAKVGLTNKTSQSCPQTQTSNDGPTDPTNGTDTQNDNSNPDPDEDAPTWDGGLDDPTGDGGLDAPTWDGGWTGGDGGGTGGGGGGGDFWSEIDYVGDPAPAAPGNMLALADDIGSDVDPSLGAFVVDPTHAATGNKVHAQTDLRAWYPNPLTFVRTYNAFGFNSASLIGQNIGVGWHSNWDMSVAMASDGTHATVVGGDGKSYLFSYNSSNGKWSSDQDVAATLVQIKDGNGYATGWTLTLPNGNVENYDALGRLTGLTVLGGPAASYALTYDSLGRLQTVSNGLGRQISFSYDSNSRVATLVDPNSGTTTYSYDSSGRLTSVTRADSRTRQYVYGNTTWPFAMTGVVDGMGTTYVTFAYDTHGRVSTSLFAGNVGGGSISYGTNESDFTDSVGTVWSKTFATNNGETELLSDTAQCSGCPTQPAQFAYDSLGYLTSYTNRNGIQTTYSYDTRDPRHLPTQMIEAVGLPEQRTTNMVWHASLPLRTQITNADNVVNYQYDANGRMTQQSITANSVTRTVTYSYNAQGLLSQVDGPRTDVSDVTSYTYDSLGNLSTVTNARGQITTYSQYNGLGEPQRIDYPNGTTRTLTYDGVGRVLTDTYAGNTRTYTYDANGKLSSVSTSDGHSTTYTYDSAHRLTDATNNFGEHIHYTLDATNKRRRQPTKIDKYDAANNLVASATIVYDGMGRVKQTKDAQGRITSYVYDGHGNPTKVTDPLSNIVQLAYDGLNRPTSVTDPLLHTIGLTYDAANRLTRFTDLNGRATQYTYNGFGDNTSLASPDTGTSSYTYDKASNTLTKLDARGKTATFSYDALSRVAQVTFADGQGVTQTYDVAPNGVGRLASMTD